MRILVIADRVSPRLYDHYEHGSFNDVDMVISCGDLPPYYLEFVVSTLNVPCFYVPGNHDSSFQNEAPPGWQSIDGRVISYQGVNLLGLGGSLRYKAGPYQYTESEMKRRWLKLKPGIWLKKQEIDIFVSHAPAYQLGDLETMPHQGFKVFRSILKSCSPKYFLHGHVHLTYSQQPRLSKYRNTQIINGFQHFVFDYQENS